MGPKRKTPSAAEAAAIAAAEVARLAAAKKASIAARERALEILLAEIAKDRASRPQQWAAPMTPSPSLAEMTPTPQIRTSLCPQGVLGVLHQPKG